MEERRKSCRKELADGFLLYNADTGAKLGSVTNISSEGFMVVHGEPLEVGETFACRLVFPEEILGASQLTFRAKSMWMEQAPYDAMYNTGFSLDLLSEDEADILQLLIENKILKS